MEESCLRNFEIRAVESQLPKKTELLFQCPECGGNEIVEILTQRRTIRVYEDNDWIWEPTSDFSESQTLRFQCGQCEYKLKNDFGKNVETISDLVPWLVNSSVQGRNTR